MNYSKAIRTARALKGIQQKQLAARSGLDPSHISLIESGKRKPSTGTVERIAEALDIPFHVLTLLGSETSDLKSASPLQIRAIGESLAGVLTGENAKPRQRSKKRHPGR